MTGRHKVLNEGGSAVCGRKLAPAVNFHLLAACNFECEHCFVANLASVGAEGEKALWLAAELGSQFDKVTFVGGEPTLRKDLHALISATKAAGATTMLVTNGSRLSEDYLNRLSGCLDWLAISVDSVNEATNRSIGRMGRGYQPPERLLALANYARQMGIRLKLNTVVGRHNWQEDLGDFVCQFRPERWKVFQVLPVAGQNDSRGVDLRITEHQFKTFLQQHSKLADRNIQMVSEDNDDMTGSYAMMDPRGRFFDNVDGQYAYTDSALDVGTAEAFSQVRFNPESLVNRGGVYNWSSER